LNLLKKLDFTDFKYHKILFHNETIIAFRKRALFQFETNDATDKEII